jgi:protein phosphatase
LVAAYLSIEYGSLTDVGVVRSHNQDNHIALPANDAEEWERRGHLFLVADGMGGHAVGELASKIAVDTIPHVYQKHANDGPATALTKAIVETNTAIFARGLQNPEFKGLGTTGTALLLAPSGAWVGHVGDSRAYRVRHDRIEQLTFDHSWVWELARQQGKKPEELQGVHSNQIWRALGPNQTVEVDIEGPHGIEPGDCYVVCSDGLSGSVSDREIGAVVSALPPKEASRFLVDLANLQGGPDNITVVVIRVAGGSVSVKSHSPSAAKTSKHAWHLAVLWPIAAMLLGTLLSLLAIGFWYAKLGGATIVFLLAAAALGTGLVGFFLQNRGETIPVEDQPAPARAKVHRQASCTLDLPLLKKLAHAEMTLGQRIRDRHWTANWDEVERHRELAERSLNSGSLTEAFREYCLAMRPLSEAVQRQRHKEEVFQPVWDKAGD